MIVLYTYFRDERAAFNRASQTLKFFAARRSQAATAEVQVEDAEIFERHGSAELSPHLPAEELGTGRAPTGWWGSLGRLARLGDRGRRRTDGDDDKPDSGSTSSESEEEPDSRSGLARARHRFRCSVGVSGPEVSYEYSRQPTSGGARLEQGPRGSRSQGSF